MASSTVPDVLVIDQDGNLSGLWTDRIDLTEIGTLDIQRASTVEFEPKRQLWVAIDAMNGTVIAAGKNRTEVLEKERAYFNALS